MWKVKIEFAEYIYFANYATACRYAARRGIVVSYDFLNREVLYA